MSSQPKKKQKVEANEDIESDVKDMKEVEESDDSEDESKDSEEDSDDMDSEDKQFIDKEITIDFSAYQPIDEDFNGIKCLLSQLWLKENINVSELTQLVIDNSSISSILKQEEAEETEEGKEESDDESDSEDDEDVYGMTSVIPLADCQHKDCIKQIQNTLTSYIPKDNEIYKLLTNSSQRIGLILNERFANLPPKISLPSFQTLMNDLKNAKNDKQIELNLDFQYFLMVCKILKPKTTNNKKSNDLEVIYVNAEEELFDELSDHRFEYSVAKQCDSDVFDWKDDENLFEPFRRVLVLKTDNWNKAINKLIEEFK